MTKDKIERAVKLFALNAKAESLLKKRIIILENLLVFLDNEETAEYIRRTDEIAKDIAEKDDKWIDKHEKLFLIPCGC
jgi:hypothetical protein